MTNQTRRNFLQHLATATAAGACGFWRTATGTLALGADPAAPAIKRVFLASMIHETNTFHPVRTTEVGTSDPPKKGAPLGHLTFGKEQGIRAVPGISVYPRGGGTIDGPACRKAIGRMVQSLRDAMPVDGVLLHLHGAMYAEGVGSTETLLLEQARAVVGRTVPIACSFDLHGNIPARLGELGNILVGLKTAPHTDQQATAELTERILVDTLLGKVKPVGYVLPIPFVVPGEKAMTTAEPFKGLVAEARRLEREGVPGHREKILAATIFAGCAWTDSPDTGMSVMITADGSRAAARAAAVHLARRIWDARRDFVFGCETAELEEGVTRALAAKESTVFLTDSGDNVTASTPGDLPLVLRHLVQRKVERAVVFGIMDEAATRRCYEAGVGARLRLSIGATVEKRFGPPLEAEVEVVRLVKMVPRAVVVRIGGVEAILTERTSAFIYPWQFQTCGIDAKAYKIVVVKEGYLFPGLMQIAPRYLMLLTPGSGDMRLERLAYRHRRKPAYPFEPDTPFDPDAAP